MTGPRSRRPGASPRPRPATARPMASPPASPRRSSSWRCRPAPHSPPGGLGRRAARRPLRPDGREQRAEIGLRPRRAALAGLARARPASTRPCFRTSCRRARPSARSRPTWRLATAFAAETVVVAGTTDGCASFLATGADAARRCRDGARHHADGQAPVRRADLFAGSRASTATASATAGWPAAPPTPAARRFSPSSRPSAWRRSSRASILAPDGSRLLSAAQARRALPDRRPDARAADVAAAGGRCPLLPGVAGRHRRRRGARLRAAGQAWRAAALPRAHRRRRRQERRLDRDPPPRARRRCPRRRHRRGRLWHGAPRPPRARGLAAREASSRHRSRSTSSSSSTSSASCMTGSAPIRAPSRRWRACAGTGARSSSCRIPASARPATRRAWPPSASIRPPGTSSCHRARSPGVFWRPSDPPSAARVAWCWRATATLRRSTGWASRRPTGRTDVDLVLIAGSEAPQRTLADYEALLAEPAARRVPALCVNPDMTMLVPGGHAFGAGRIARLYEALGGQR